MRELRTRAIDRLKSEMLLHAGGLWWSPWLVPLLQGERAAWKQACSEAGDETRARVDLTRPSTVSTALLKVFRPLHMRPINPVVFRGSLAYASNIDLEGGFLLRCFQRLSLRHLATLRWHERANRRTRGGSFQVLSY